MMAAKNNHIRTGLKISSFLMGILLTISSCTYVIPESENPNPGLEQASTIGIVQDGVLSIRKEFFGIEIDQEKNKVKNNRKTWLCGWAPISQGGEFKNIAALSATPYSTRHCNVEFQISQDGTNLEAREIDVDYPNDISKWQLLFVTPIKSHYFYEKDVDSRGRELNKYKKVTDRKNWELRPIMDLDLKNTFFANYSKRPMPIFSGQTLTDIHDIEFEKEENKNFFAFTANQVSNYYGSAIQNEMRFNFLEIKENLKFKKTPYNTRNAKHMNILHILGSRPDGMHEVNWAAHWDVSKPVEFCLNGFPDDSRNYRQIGIDVIEEMNKAMEKIGAVEKGQKAFVVSKRQPKFHFDLRCPSITWVDDPNLSFRAPLGIGLVNANIKTGEILWGGAVIWGGLIDYIVNRDSESVVDALSRNTNEMLRGIELKKNNPYFKDIQSQLDIESWGNGKSFKTMKDIFSNDVINDPVFKNGETQLKIDELVMALQNYKPELGNDSQKEMAALAAKQIREYLNDFQNKEALSSLSQIGKMGFNFDDLDENFKLDLGSQSDNISLIKRLTGLNSSFSMTESEQDDYNFVKKRVNGGINGSEASEFLAKNFAARQADVIDSENLVENHYYSWQEATAGLGALEKLAASKSVIKNVTLHELGHVVGLGHQFEGNRLPEKGMVPDLIFNELEKESHSRHNYSSIMDYQSGHTEVSLPYEKVKIQAQDEQVLAYLYLQKYSGFKSGDAEFKYFDLPANGLIPNQTEHSGQKYETRYLPQCSDFDAWLATSPYCRRWDRGHDAPVIVDENVKEYTDSFISRMNSFSEASGANPFMANYVLWSSTYNLMNNNRTFYDHLRYLLSSNQVYSTVFDKIKKNKEALLGFSKSCIDPSLASTSLQNSFAKLALQPLASSVSGNRLEDIQANADYSTLLKDYIEILGDLNSRELSNDEFADLERKLNDKGVAFTEVQKLCRASKKSIEAAQLLLSLKGPDHPNMNYETVIVPTGLRGGNATTDYSRMFGTYNQLGLLPIKLATLDVLTNTSSTMSYGWWQVGKPKFADREKGKFGYFTLYPEEFTHVIGTSVRNNMGFGGTKLQDAASMSVANLYMSHFLFRTFFWSNDTQARGIHANYLEDIKAQTKFDVNLVAVLLESVTIPGEPTNKKFGFRPKLFNLAKRTLTDLPEAYALPDKKVIVKGNDSQIIMPISRMRFLSSDAAYVFALEVTYDKTAYDDPLQGYTVKNSISELTTQELDKCISGATGLASYFNSNEEFKGFQIDPQIATDIDAQTNFEKSLKESFANYQSRESLAPSQVGCEESVKGIGLITSTALSLNGFILPQVYDYIKK